MKDDNKSNFVPSAMNKMASNEEAVQDTNPAMGDHVAKPTQKVESPKNTKANGPKNPIIGNGPVQPYMGNGPVQPYMGNGPLKTTIANQHSHQIPQNQTNYSLNQIGKQQSNMVSSQSAKQSCNEELKDTASELEEQKNKVGDRIRSYETATVSQAGKLGRGTKYSQSINTAFKSMYTTR